MDITNQKHLADGKSTHIIFHDVELGKLILEQPNREIQFTQPISSIIIPKLVGLSGNPVPPVSCNTTTKIRTFRKREVIPNHAHVLKRNEDLEFYVWKYCIQGKIRYYTDEKEKMEKFQILEEGQYGLVLCGQNYISECLEEARLMITTPVRSVTKKIKG